MYGLMSQCGKVVNKGRRLRLRVAGNDSVEWICERLRDGWGLGAGCAGLYKDEKR